MKEYILCAAIWWDDGKKYNYQPKNIQTGIVICGRRHHNIIAIKSRVGCSAFQKSDGKQGFLTNTDIFVDRKEAFKIAEAAGQIIKGQHMPPELDSSDLY